MLIKLETMLRRNAVFRLSFLGPNHRLNINSKPLRLLSSHAWLYLGSAFGLQRYPACCRLLDEVEGGSANYKLGESTVRKCRSKAWLNALCRDVVWDALIFLFPSTPFLVQVLFGARI